MGKGVRRSKSGWLLTMSEVTAVDPNVLDIFQSAAQLIVCYSPPAHLAQLSCAFSCVLRFLLLWSAVLIMYPTSLAVISLTFSNYVLQPVFPNCIPPYNASRILSMVCLREYLLLVNTKLASFCKGSLSKAGLMAPKHKRQAGVCPAHWGGQSLPACLQGAQQAAAHPWAAVADELTHSRFPTAAWSPLHLLILKCRHVGSAYHHWLCIHYLQSWWDWSRAMGKEDILCVP